MSFLDHIVRCNRFEPADYVPFIAGGRPVGWIGRERAGALAAFGKSLSVDDRAVTLVPALSTFEARTEALREAEAWLVAHGLVPKLRRERFPVVAEWGEKPLASIDRGVVPFFGVRAFGVHLNGLCAVAGETRMWIARRAQDKVTDGGKLDNIVAGGQPHGLSLIDNLVKECREEAAIPADLARRAVAAGYLRYAVAVEGGLRRDTLFLFDLDLPPGFTPANTDGEVESFALMEIDEVAARVRDTDDFKFNVPLVIIDWLLRHDRLPVPDPDEKQRIRAGLQQDFPA